MLKTTLLGLTIAGLVLSLAGPGECKPVDYMALGDEINVNLGSLDAPDQLQPTYELWTIRRESWLPPFPLKRRYDRDREAASRSEE